MSSEKLDPLKPYETIQRILVSSTSRFVGEFDNAAILISHAFPNFQDRGGRARFTEGPSSRSGLTISFRTPPLVKEVGIVLPNYEAHGDLFCSYLAVLFGKRFDTHGPFETNGNFWLPDMSRFDQFINHLMPQHRHSPRADFSFPLDLRECKRFEAVLLDPEIDPKIRSTLQGACRFYLRALQAAENDIEIAYLHLITAGEIISSAMRIDRSIIIDDETRSILERVRSEMKDGERVSRQIQSKLLQIKRRFIHTITQLVDEAFFDRREAREPFNTFKKDTFRDMIAAAYDIRSRYVHTGIAFGGWMSPRGDGANEEIQIGRPVVPDKEFANLLGRAPTYIGLERVIRYTILKFASEHRLFDINPDLTTSE